MANTSIKVKELHFKVESDQIVVTVTYISDDADNPFWGGGTKTKAFPASRNVVDIIGGEIAALDFLTWDGAFRGNFDWLSRHPEQEQFVKIHLHCGGSYIQPLSDIGHAMDAELDGVEIGQFITLDLEPVLMTREEYDKLPEFGGH